MKSLSASQIHPFQGSSLRDRPRGAKIDQKKTLIFAKRTCSSSPGLPGKFEVSMARKAMPISLSAFWPFFCTKSFYKTHESSNIHFEETECSPSSRCETRGGKEGRSPLTFFENWKKVPKFWKKDVLIVFMYGLNLSFKVQFL